MNPEKSNTDSSSDSLMKPIGDLFPICRSITGNGLRETLAYIKDCIGIDIVEVPTGTQVFDWKIPGEWNIQDAYIADEAGKRIVDFRENNLHIVSYSEPVNTQLSLEALRNHIHTIPDKPSAIPYVTSYYKRTWGFCMSADQLSALTDESYRVLVDSSIQDGSLSYGELLIPGEDEREILISCHCCHPSLANDNLSGVSVAIALAKKLLASRPKWSYRFLFLPGTIGAITWLATHTDQLEKIVGGLTLANLGDSGHFNYKRSRQGFSWMDRVVQHVLESSGARFGIREFTPYGYDERQYCSPGINLAVGSFTRSVHGTFPEYHTSDDNLSFVSEENLQGSLRMLEEIINVLENDDTYLSQAPYGEPQLGVRGLYSQTGGYGAHPDMSMAYLWVLNLSDGDNSLLDISKRSGISFEVILDATQNLANHGFLEKVSSEP